MVSRCGEGSAFTVIKEIIVDAEIKNVGKVENFTGDFLNKVARDKINPSRAYVVIDEIFSNIAYYAYPNGKGEVTVRLEWEDETSLFTNLCPNSLNTGISLIKASFKLFIITPSPHTPKLISIKLYHRIILIL